VPTALEVQILQVVNTLTSADRPATFNDLARRLGATAPLIASLARGLVADGLVQPSYIQVHGVRTLHGLMPQPVTTAQP
jgi:Mn-dependent DtxR family transcriptional regulator